MPKHETHRINETRKREEYGTNNRSSISKSELENRREN